MRRERIDAFVFPSTDAHNSEYVAEHWKSREWISGFDGSAGTAVVTMRHAALWTDSRYFLAAEQQLAGTGYELMRLKVAGTPTIAEWLGSELADIDGAVVGLDGAVNSANRPMRNSTACAVPSVEAIATVCSSLRSTISRGCSTSVAVMSTAIRSLCRICWSTRSEPRYILIR